MGPLVAFERVSAHPASRKCPRREPWSTAWQARPWRRHSEHVERVKRFLLLFPLFLVGVVGLGLAMVFTCYPKVDGARPLPPVAADGVEHGAYLANAVATCTTCHSPRDWTRFSGPVDAQQLGAGGDAFDREFGLPGIFTPPNLTPTHLADWSDAEVAHAVSSGVNRNGDALMPVMPYLSYGGLCIEDQAAIVAYLRTLDPQPERDGAGVRELDFPLPLLIRTFPQQGDPPPCPGENDPVEYKGGYLTRAAGCANCHTPLKEGRPVADKAFSGGSVFRIPGGPEVEVVSSNITPDEITGIGRWTEAEFVERFARYRDPAALALEADAKNTTMPWAAYAQMSDEDLAAIFAFLKGQNPVSNKVPGQVIAPDPDADPNADPDSGDESGDESDVANSEDAQAPLAPSDPGTASAAEPSETSEPSSESQSTPPVE